MDELIKRVSAKTGISEDTAEQAVEIVINFLKDRLPDPIADQLEDLMEGKKVDLSGLLKDVDMQEVLKSDAMQNVMGSLFGGAQGGEDDEETDPNDLLKGLSGMFGKG